MEQTAIKNQRSSTHLQIGLLIAVLAISIIGFATLGEGGPIIARLAAIVDVLLRSGWMPIVYMLGAWGYGRVLWKGDGDHAWIARLGIGFALMLSITHLLGMLGMLNVASSWILSGAGVMLAVALFVRDQKIGTNFQCTLDGITMILWIVIASVVGLMIVAASNPPGILWDSEYGNYDSLSYHLELPRAWIEQGRVWPIGTNVYSYLPSYIESSYVHMAMLAGAGGDGFGLADDSGRGIYAAQLLSVLLTLLSALVSGSVARKACKILGIGEFGDLAGLIVSALVLTTPWMVVVGTISYNESAVVLLTMCGIAIALETQWSAMRRTIGVAVFMGVACCCKPTALFLAAPMVGVVFFALIPFRAWWRVVLVGSTVGTVMLLPWLIRNELATGNPVFPMVNGIFGDGHWTTRQHEVYSAAHSFDGLWMDRIKMLVLPDPDGVTHVERFRGLTNMQWGITAGMGMLGLLVLLTMKETRRAGVVCLVGMGIVLIAWMGLTHLQSRFLVPMVGVFAVLGGIGGARLCCVKPRGLVCVLGVLPALWVGVQYANQAVGNPNSLLDLGTAAYTGEVQGAENALWWSGVNRIANDGKGVYLVGDATPAYVRSPVIYNTTYDDWLIGDLMREYPDDPDAWNRNLMQRGIGWIVINLSEIDRFTRSGWGDPDVTTDAMLDWSKSFGNPKMVWNSGRRVMFMLEFSSNTESTDENNDG